MNGPAKKAIRVETPETVSNNTLLDAINKIGETQRSFLEKSVSVESAVKEIKDQVSGINGRLDMAEEKISAITAENKMLRNRVNELESYLRRRWNLKISGIPEQDEENVKMTVIDLLSRISPTIADTLQNSVDVAHRLGPRPKKRYRFLTTSPHHCAILGANDTRPHLYRRQKFRGSQTKEH